MDYLLTAFVFIAIGFILYSKHNERRYSNFLQTAKPGTPCQYSIYPSKVLYTGTIHSFDEKHIYSFVMAENGFKVKVHSNNIYPPKLFKCGKKKLGKRKSSLN